MQAHLFVLTNNFSGNCLAMKPTTDITFSSLFLALITIASINMSLCSGSTYVSCLENEREALLRFKHDLHDPSDRLVSWNIGDADCCKWAGVICHNITGHVVQLRLGNPYEVSKLGGKMNPSLLELKHLYYLDLSGNNFEGIEIPKFLGSMGKLRYLNLSRTGFIGMIPHQLGNLSNLQYLDLNGNFDNYAETLSWLSSLSSMNHIDLSCVNLDKVSDWLPAINSLPSLTVIKLAFCQLHYFPSLSLSSDNFSSLTTVDLSDNQLGTSVMPWVFGLSDHLVFLDLSLNSFEGSIPHGLGNLTSLRYLDLSANNFNSTIPESFFCGFGGLEFLSLWSNLLQGPFSSCVGNLTSIQTLDLSFNNLEGKIPTSFRRLCNLRSLFLSHSNMNQKISEILNIFSTCILDGLEVLEMTECQLFGHFTDRIRQLKNLKTFSLSNNFISGPIPLSLGQLSSLESVNLSNNTLFESLSEIHFAKLSKLKSFDVSKNSLTLNVSPDWIPAFQLKELNLESCNLVGNRFPSWLLSQKSLLELDISNSRIQDTIPDKFWESSPQLYSLNVSNNRIHGEIPNLSKATHLQYLDLSSNNFYGPLPPVSSNELYGIDLSNNYFSGSIFQLLCHGLKESKELEILDIGENVLSGEIPDCWMNFQSLKVLNLGNNNFSGNLPFSMGTLSSLESLHLQKNTLFGKIPESFKNCTQLLTLNIGDNKFSGNVPAWIGESFSRIIILILRSNKFDGLFPTEFCLLTSLQIIDLACNNLSGGIPRCISNLSAMATMNYSVYNDITYSTNFRISIEKTSLVMKGKNVEYSSILNLVRTIDLSENNFSGEVPAEVTELLVLQSLNWSHNHFAGRLPENIGVMRSLESIDFSYNKLNGEIPQSTSSLTFLNRLNLSYNNLSGEIPLSTQLQSFDASCFLGNDNLCGYPLSKNCTENVSVPEVENEDEDDEEVNWFIVSMAPGFVVGFWSVIGPLIVCRRWRYMYSDFLDDIGEKVSNFRIKYF